jgi:ABC-type phosphate/phosphonate transport system substrate-binding protein
MAAESIPDPRSDPMSARHVALAFALTLGLPPLAPCPALAADEATVPCECECECECECGPALRIGAVAYGPSVVTVFEGLRRHFDRNGMPVDYVLYSNYDALVQALADGDVDIAWNTPLAHAQYHLKAGGSSKTLVMRDVDCDFRSVLVAREDAGIDSVGQLEGKTLVLGSNDAAESTVLPTYYLNREGLDLDTIDLLSLDGQLDQEGNPCSSEHDVLAALLDGRGEAGVIGERLWNHLKRTRPEAADSLKLVWTTPSFSHCVFTAPADLDPELARRFTELMTSMDPADPLAADVMRLEGTKAWVVGSPDGFVDLLEALREDQ